MGDLLERLRTPVWEQAAEAKSTRDGVGQGQTVGQRARNPGRSHGEFSSGWRFVPRDCELSRGVALGNVPCGTLGLWGQGERGSVLQRRRAWDVSGPSSMHLFDRIEAIAPPPSRCVVILRHTFRPWTSPARTCGVTTCILESRLGLGSGTLRGGGPTSRMFCAGPFFARAADSAYVRLTRRSDRILWRPRRTFCTPPRLVFSSINEALPAALLYSSGTGFCSWQRA